MGEILITNKYTKEIIFRSTKAKTTKESVKEAILSKTNLSGTDLSGANLLGSNLSGADLSGANLLFCKMDKKVFKQITEDWFEWKINKD